MSDLDQAAIESARQTVRDIASPAVIVGRDLETIDLGLTDEGVSWIVEAAIRAYQQAMAPQVREAEETE
jgi:hypothetical protein